MEARTNLPAAEGASDQSAAPRTPGCPVCNGLLIDVHGMLRCPRCCFSTCAGCEGAVAVNSPWE